MISMIKESDLIALSTFGERDKFDYIAFAKELASLEFGQVDHLIMFADVIITFTDYATRRNDIIDRVDLSLLNDLIWQIKNAWVSGYETYRREHKGK